MSIQDSRSEYTARMHRVLEHIDRHLDEPLPLDSLAAVANFSPFHFHRLFSAWMGETLGDYLRRRRLEMAALRLVSQPDFPVLHVALSVGFGSAEAFARAFKTRFTCTPSEWRRRERAQRTLTDEAAPRSGPPEEAESNPGQAKRNQSQASHMPPADHGTSRVRAEEVLMKVTLVNRQPTHVAYMRYVGPYGKPVSEFWQNIVYPWLVANNLLGHDRYGISHDDPGIASSDKCRYDACVEVPQDFAGTGRYQTTEIPGGRYAVTQFKGTAEGDIVKAWASLLRDWLPASGMQLDARPFFEYYGPDATYDPKTGVFSCDLCIPVAAL